MTYFKFLIITILLSNTVSSNSAKEVIMKADKRMQGESSKSSMSMQIIRPDWSRTIKMKSWSLGNKYSLVLITAPKRDKGSAFLKRENEIWNWQPSIDRVIKLPPSMMMQSWMGSDFTNDDLVRQSSIVDDYSHNFIDDKKINNSDCYGIELIPNEDAAVVWGKIEMYIDKKNYNQHLIKFYDEDDYLVNTMKLSEIKMMDGKEIPTRMEIIPEDEPENRTVIIYESLEFDVKLDKSFFSIRNLKKVR